MAEHLAMRGLSVPIASVQANITDLRVPIPSGRIIRIDSFIGAANANGAFTVDVNKNGVSIFGSPAARPSIAAGATTDDASGLAVAVVRGDVITVDADAIPSGGVSGFYILITFEDDFGLRSTLTYTTAVLANNATANVAIPGMGRGWILLKAESDWAAWLRIYTTAAKRTADSARLITEDAAEGAGLCAEVIFTALTLVAEWGAPFPQGFNLDDATSLDAIAAITNKSGGTRAITITLTRVPLEK